jgi:formate hydrogenlyase subunit 3/multisubunit Na+/H+ antiporter MnhD subunit
MLYLLSIVFPIAIAAGLFLLRRRTVPTVTVALASLAVQLVIALQIPVDDPTRFLGVTLTISALNRVFLLVFLGVGAVALLAGLQLTHGENFVPIMLLTLAQIAMLLMLQDPFIMSLVLVATGLTVVLALVDLPVGASSLVGRLTLATAVKYLVLMVVAGVLMYTAYVLTEIFRPGEVSSRIPLARFILALLAVGFALRMALIPFHTWLVDLVSHAEALVTLVVIALLAPAGMLVLVLTLQSFPTLIFESESALTVMRLGGLASAVLAAGLALTVDGLRRRIAYLLLVDGGVLFYGLTSLSTVGLTGAMLAALNQTLAVTLTFISLALIERPDGRAPGASRADMLRRWPIAGTGLIAGLVGLVGLPPFGGGFARLLIFQSAATREWYELIGLLAATAVSALALARLARDHLIGPGEPQESIESLMIGETELDRPPPRRLDPEPRIPAVLVVTLVIILLALGSFPQPMLATIDAALRGLAFLRSS